MVVSGKEDRFQDLTARMAEYLESIGCTVPRVVIGRTPFSTISAIKRSVHATGSSQAYALIYAGHGWNIGWEGCAFYFWILHHLRKLSGPLIVINDTCYGFNLKRKLETFRDPQNTCFISPWDSHGETFGGPLEDCLTAWQQRLRPEDIIEDNIYSTQEWDVEIPITYQRWGTPLDHLFFPA